MAESLRDLLDADPAPGIAALPEADRTRLIEVIEAARRKQAAALEASFHATLKHIPFPLRGVVRKVLLG